MLRIFIGWDSRFPEPADVLRYSLLKYSSVSLDIRYLKLAELSLGRPVDPLASPLPEATDVGVLSAAYVLFTAVLGPVAAKHANRLADLRLFSLLAARS